MRLLRCSDIGDFSLAKDLVGDDTIPPYAILSHTWGADTEEVTFEELENRTGKNKAGYDKIRFCEEQAAKDGLQYFWVDTCCIDKSSSAELTEAINSMFAWYQDSEECYVYLADFEADPQKALNLWSDKSLENLRTSRWFSRGWTLQEFIAPPRLLFFDAAWRQFGDFHDDDFVAMLVEITKIPLDVFIGPEDFRSENEGWL
jgi:hypothetical protein